MDIVGRLPEVAACVRATLSLSVVKPGFTDPEHALDVEHRSASAPGEGKCEQTRLRAVG